MRIVEPSVELIWVTPNAEKIIELAGRTCYKSEPKVFKDCAICHGEFTTEDCPTCFERSSKEFIQKIIKMGHESVLEHAVVSLRVVCDRGISHEFVRSRIGFSYSQESSRYCNYSDDKFGKEITVIKPSGLKEDYTVVGFGSVNLDWFESIEKSEKSYNAMIHRGHSPQQARSILPTCLKTEIAVTANIRAWRNFLKQRLAKSAHPDMRIIAKLIFNILTKECPNCFFDIDGE
jgi:thymidylate synthase (FAD)